MRKGTNLQVTLLYKGPPPKKWPANNDTSSSFLPPSALAIEEFFHVLTGLEHSEMMDLVPSNIAYNRSLRCPI